MSGLDPLLEAVFGTDESSQCEATMCLERLAAALGSIGLESLCVLDGMGRSRIAWPKDFDASALEAEFDQADFSDIRDNGDVCILPESNGSTTFFVRFEDAKTGYFAGRVEPVRTDGRSLALELADLMPTFRTCGFAIGAILLLSESSARSASRVDQLTNQYEALREEYCRSVAAKLEAYDERLRDQKRYAAQLEEDVAERTRKLFEKQVALQNYANKLKAAKELQEENANRLEKLVNELEAAKAVAEEAVECKSAFLANMSHEIRTPLTAILGFTDLLKNDEELHQPEQRAEALDTIQRNGQHLLELINDILDLSKIEANRLVVEKIRCSPAEIVRDVRGLMQLRAKAKELTFVVAAKGAVPQTIASDPTRLRQILINLVGNAIKFTHAGSVQLIVSLITDGPQPQMRFDVIDSGIGMSEKQLTGIFDPFTQADASTTRQFGGTGLGLSICKRLAELLGGSISVTSRLGEGSTFTVIVPTGSLDGVPLAQCIDVPTPAPPVEVAAQATPGILTDCRILLAEDGLDNQRLISFLLRKAGADVTVVENGKLAYEHAVFTKEGRGTRAEDPLEPFHIILMDMQMPVLDGYGATARIRSEGCEIPIVALTANTMQGDRERCLEAGCNEYLFKPIDRKTLIDTVARLTGRLGSESQPTAVTSA
ncbi:MAG: ATP-binding protein [Planctomycetaceae bacterium]